MAEAILFLCFFRLKFIKLLIIILFCGCALQNGTADICSLPTEGGMELRQFLADWTWFEKGLLLLSTVITIVLSIVWKDTPIGIVSAISGILSVILCAKGKSVNYLFGVLYTVTFVYMAYENKFYGQMLVNAFYYLPMNVLGYFMWNRSKRSEEEEITTRKLSPRGLALTALLCVVGVAGYSLLLRWMEGNLAVMDALVTVLSIVALYLQTKRYTETWIMWFVYNVASCALWIFAVVSGTSESITMLIMNLTYLVNSVYGYYNWRRLEGQDEAYA